MICHTRPLIAPKPPDRGGDVPSVIAAYQAVTTLHLQRPPDPIVGLARASDRRTRPLRLNARMVDEEVASIALV